ncbi:hypothetical protein L1O03_10340 [Corynebacterium uropygiale]|uniref:Uncharacterized protein n=1 Tax=Corynebacterium uropygiale TaxID=1775911 RepID=A0A9X1U1H2_9CORY|nr:hypothetical protein [Corynebacterium uropygiale]MCF4007563.1 hypothetical protein [Corynebacterium uropygiale]
MKSPNPSIQHSEGWTLYLFNPSGSSDSESVRRAKDSALQSFFRVQQNRDKALSDGTRVRVQTTSDYQDADGIRSTVCAVEDWGHDALAIQVDRGAPDLWSTGDGISKEERQCGQAMRVLEAWSHQNSTH